MRITLVEHLVMYRDLARGWYKHKAETYYHDGSYLIAFGDKSPYVLEGAFDYDDLFQPIPNPQVEIKITKQW